MQGYIEKIDRGVTFILHMALRPGTHLTKGEGGPQQSQHFNLSLLIEVSRWLTVPHQNCFQDCMLLR